VTPRPGRPVEEEVWRPVIAERDPKHLCDFLELFVATDDSVFLDDVVRVEQ